MRTTNFWGGAIALASIAAGVGTAGAADLAVKAPYKGPPAYISDWGGFYIGANGGFGWGEVTDVKGTKVKINGGLVGGQAGYNWQYGSVVFGVEGDFDAAEIDKTLDNGHGVSQKVKIDELASARARLGYIVAPNLLAYGTGGAGWGHMKFFDSVLGTGEADKWGWTAGAGLEYKLWGNFLARAEYLHYDFDRNSLGIKTKVDTVRGGLSYKF